MKVEQLNQIIKDKNEQRERQTLKTAEQIIEGIVQHQKVIEGAQQHIQNLRDELVTLQVEQLDPKTVLGVE